MNYLVAFLLLVVVYVLTNENESYGFAGYTTPRETQLMDPFPNMNGFQEVKNDATADLMESVVLLTNKEIHKRTGISNYIIETTSMKKFQHEKEPAKVYECRFMTVKKNGFSFGFSVVVWFIVQDQEPIRLMAIRSQPIGFQPSDQPTEKSMAKEFLDYKIVKENHVPNRGDFDASMSNFRDPNAQFDRVYIPEPPPAPPEAKARSDLQELSDEVESGVNTARRDTNNFLRGLENDPALIRGLKTIERGLETAKNNLR